MAEYIEKAAVIADLMEQIEKGRDTAECEATELVIKRFAEYIGSFPAADVQPVKHGQWIAENRDNRGYADCYTCTNCNCYTYTYTLMKNCEYDYCPNCGADMRNE